MLKFVYSFFLGLLLAVFVGMGVATFYPEPKPPEYPTALTTKVDVADEASEAERAAYEQQYQAYNTHANDYSRNVSMIVLAAAVLLLVLGLLLESRASVIADGLLLGGTFTLLYSILRSFTGDDPKYSFVVVTVGLIATMLVGYLKFIKPEPKVPARPKKK